MKKIWISVRVLLLLLGFSPGAVFAEETDTQTELLGCLNNSDILATLCCVQAQTEMGDFNNDDKVDVALCVRKVPTPPCGICKIPLSLEACVESDSIIQSNIKVFMNEGTGNFTDQTTERLPERRFAAAIEVEDIDADNDLDIIGVRAAGIDCYINDGTGKFTLKEAPKPPAPPIARASAAPIVGKAPLTVQFSSEGSVDPDGGVLTYHWDFGDGASSSEANPEHTYQYACASQTYTSEEMKDILQLLKGSMGIGIYLGQTRFLEGIRYYTATLTVTDVEGKTASAKVGIVVRKSWK